MKKIYYLTILIAALFSTTSVKAQLLGNNERYSQYIYHFNIGVDGLYNVNPGQSTYNPGVGISAKFQYDITQNLGLTVGTGYTVITADNSNVLGSNPNLRPDLKIVPLRLGAKAYFLPEFYFGGEVGVAYVDPYLAARTRSKFAKILAPAVGYETNHLDVSFRYENINNQNTYVSFVALRAAYIFNF
jgi:hypothetical protein